jgi:hypothetical protein
MLADLRIYTRRYNISNIHDNDSIQCLIMSLPFTAELAEGGLAGSQEHQQLQERPEIIHDLRSIMISGRFIRSVLKRFHSVFVHRWTILTSFSSGWS